MDQATGWLELHRCRSLHEARRLATSIAAMEFDIECRDVRGRSVLTIDDDANAQPPFSVLVRPSDHAELRDVVREIIAEQDEFDAMLEAKRRTSGRVQRVVLLLLIAAMTLLAMFGLLRL